VLVLGLADGWRRMGLGPTRSAIANAAPAPVLFVRRGTRTGLFASRDNVTRFKWSIDGLGSPQLHPWSQQEVAPALNGDERSSAGDDVPSSPVS
jgi:hypothetical protein